MVGIAVLGRLLAYVAEALIALTTKVCNHAPDSLPGMEVMHICVAWFACVLPDVFLQVGLKARSRFKPPLLRGGRLSHDQREALNEAYRKSPALSVRHAEHADCICIARLEVWLLSFVCDQCKAPAPPDSCDKNQNGRV